MKFIDSNIIAFAFYDNPHKEHCQNILKQDGVINTLVLVEAFQIIEQQVSREYATKVVRGLLKCPLQIVTIDINIVFEAIKRAEKINHLKYLDLIHYTTAHLYACDSMITFDKDFNGLDIPREEPV